MQGEVNKKLRRSKGGGEGAAFQVVENRKVCALKRGCKWGHDSLQCPHMLPLPTWTPVHFLTHPRLKSNLHHSHSSHRSLFIHFFLPSIIHPFLPYFLLSSIHPSIHSLLNPCSDPVPTGGAMQLHRIGNAPSILCHRLWGNGWLNFKSASRVQKQGRYVVVDWIRAQYREYPALMFHRRSCSYRVYVCVFVFDCLFNCKVQFQQPQVVEHLLNKWDESQANLAMCVGGLYVKVPTMGLRVSQPLTLKFPRTCFECIWLYVGYEIFMDKFGG